MKFTFTWDVRKTLRECQVEAEVKEKRGYGQERDWKLQRDWEITFANIQDNVEG